MQAVINECRIIALGELLYEIIDYFTETERWERERLAASACLHQPAN